MSFPLIVHFFSWLTIKSQWMRNPRLFSGTISDESYVLTTVSRNSSVIAPVFPHCLRRLQQSPLPLIDGRFVNRRRRCRYCASEIQSLTFFKFSPGPHSTRETLVVRNTTIIFNRCITYTMFTGYSGKKSVINSEAGVRKECSRYVIENSGKGEHFDSRNKQLTWWVAVLCRRVDVQPIHNGRVECPRWWEWWRGEGDHPDCDSK